MKGKTFIKVEGRYKTTILNLIKNNLRLAGYTVSIIKEEHKLEASKNESVSSFQNKGRW